MARQQDEAAHHDEDHEQHEPDAVLPSWDQALNELGDQPHHVARFGARFDAQGVLAASKDAARCIGYLTKVPHQADRRLPPRRERRAAPDAAWLTEALRFQPCSPQCANWLRYGVQPKNARARRFLAGARARPTTVITSAMPGAGACLPQVVRQDPR